MVKVRSWVIFGTIWNVCWKFFLWKNLFESKPFIEVLFVAPLLFSVILGVLLFLADLLEFRTVHSLLSGFESTPVDNLDRLCFPTRSKFNILSFDKHTSCFSSWKFLTELDSSFSNNLKDLCGYYTNTKCMIIKCLKLLQWLEIPDPFPLFVFRHFLWLTSALHLYSLHSLALLPCFDKFQMILQHWIALKTGFQFLQLWYYIQILTFLSNLNLLVIVN